MSKIKVSIRGQDEKAVLNSLDSVDDLRRDLQRLTKNSEFLWVQGDGLHLAIPIRYITMIEITE